VWENHADTECVLGGAQYAVELLDELRLAAPIMRQVLHDLARGRAWNVSERGCGVDVCRHTVGS
jgi:hypothetical protein